MGKVKTAELKLNSERPTFYNCTDYSERKYENNPFMQFLYDFPGVQTLDLL